MAVQRGFKKSMVAVIALWLFKQSNIQTAIVSIISTSIFVNRSKKTFNDLSGAQNPTISGSAHTVHQDNQGADTKKSERRVSHSGRREHDVSTDQE